MGCETGEDAIGTGEHLDRCRDRRIPGGFNVAHGQGNPTVSQGHIDAAIAAAGTDLGDGSSFVDRSHQCSKRTGLGW